MAKHFSATGSNRLVFFGQMAACDDFGRIRILLLADMPDGSADHSADTVKRAVDKALVYGLPITVPYEIDRVSRDGVRGTATLVAPDRHKAHWLKVAAELRGRRVRVEAGVRPYVFPGKKSGVSLDISMIELG